MNHYKPINKQTRPTKSEITVKAMTDGARKTLLMRLQAAAKTPLTSKNISLVKNGRRNPPHQSHKQNKTWKMKTLTRYNHLHNRHKQSQSTIQSVLNQYP